MATTETGKDSKVTLKVITVGEARTVGQRSVVGFTCEGGDGYETWEDSLKPLVVPGVELVCDVTHTETEGKDDRVFKHHKVTQIYVDGKPVKQWQQRGGGGGKSPEERASIETQVAVKAFTDLWIAGKIPDGDPLVRLVKLWCGSRIEPAIGRAPTVSKTDVSQVVVTTVPKPIPAPVVPPKDAPPVDIPPTIYTPPTVTPSATEPTPVQSALPVQGDPEWDKLHRAEQTSPPEAKQEHPPVAPFGIDMDWLDGALKRIHWGRQTVGSYLKSLGAEVDTSAELKDILAGITGEQRGAFLAKVNELVGAA